MTKPQLLKGKTAASLAFMAMLLLVSSASAQVTVTTANQQGAANTYPFTPTWTPATDSLIAGLAPTTATGNFSLEVAGRSVNSLTSGGSLAINQIPATQAGNNTCSTNYVTYGSGQGAGSLLIYTLPTSVNGYNLTNITVDGGWANNGRDALGFTVLYSTVANPTSFIFLANVNYNPSVGNNIASATQAAIQNASGGLIAANVAAVEFIFTFPGVENNYCGMGAITVEGTVAANIVSAVSITTSNQSGANPYTPTWTAETPDLIAGLSPSTTAGTFNMESSGGIPVLTDGLIGHSGTIGGFATCGANAGTTLIYTLTNTVNGSDVTNIVTYSGWGDGGRDGQYYIVSYSTIAAPLTFVPLTTIYYLPSFSGAAPANRVAIFNSTGAPLASGVAKIKFDFSSPPSAGSFNNGYQGYSEIIIQGKDTTTATPPSLAQDTLPSYASTVIGDQVVFTASFSNSPPVSLQWLFISGGVTNVLAGQTSSTLTLNNLQLTNSGSYQLEATFSPNPLAAAPSFSTPAPLVVNSTPVAVNNIIMNYAEQAGLGAAGGTSTNFYPTWTVDTANNLIYGSLTNSSLGVPGTFIAGSGNFDMNIPVYGTGPGPLSPDPTILSDGSGIYVTYWPNVGGNIAQCSCGAGGAGDTMTYTLPNSAANGFDLTNITVYGGWGDHGRNEQKYQVLYSTIYNPTVFINMGTFDYNPNDPNNTQSATRTMLIPVSGPLAKNVYSVQINWNVSPAPKNNWEGYSEIVVKGTPSLANPVLAQDILPASAQTVVGDQVVFTAAFSNSPAANLQWQFITTNGVVGDIAGQTGATLTLNNVQLTNTGSYRLKAINQTNSLAVFFSSSAPLVVTPVPAPVNNVVITAAGQIGWGPGATGISTNFTPTWTANYANDLILGSVDGSIGTAGTVYAGLGNFGLAGANGDPQILSDGISGNLIYNPGAGGNLTLDTCGPYSTVPGANYPGISVTYTLDTTSAVNGFDLTNIVVYGGWGDSSQNEQRYQVLYSTVGAPNTFIPMTGWVDYLPANASGYQSATRTTLTPAAGVLAGNVYAVQINFNSQNPVPKNRYSGYAEIIVAGQAAPPRPLLTQDISPAAAEDVVGGKLTLAPAFINATSYQWLKNGTNLTGATSSTLTFNNLQFTDTATNGGYSLMAINANGTNVSSACTVYVDPAPTPTNNVLTAFAYQSSSAANFSPTWDTSLLGSSLIVGQNPPSGGSDTPANFTGGGDNADGLPVLTDGSYGTFASDGTHPAFAAAGPGAGNYVIYTLGSNPNGYSVTNIQIAGGWNDFGRDSQFYTILYSTVANPNMFIPLVSVANNLSAGNGEAAPSASVPTAVRGTFTPMSGVLASNVYAIQVGFQFPEGVPNGYSGYSEISVFGSPSATLPTAGPVITVQNEQTVNTWTVETPNLIAGQLPSSQGPGVFTGEGCNVTNLTDGILGFGAAFGAACGVDPTASVSWIAFTPTNGSWNLTNIVVYTLWTDYGRDGQFYNLSYSTTSNPTIFLPLASVAYNPFVPAGVPSGNRVAIAPPIGQSLLASNVAAVKFDFTPQGSQDFGWSGYTEIVLQGTNLPSAVVFNPVLGTPKISGGNLVLTGTGGAPNGGYTWLTTTNLATPVANWTVSLTGTFDSNGAFSNSIPVNTVQPTSFFRLRTP